MNLQFEYPWVLFLLWLVPVAGLLTYRLTGRNTAGGRLVSPEMAARLAPPVSPTRRLWQLSLLMTGLLLALIAAARPQWGTREETAYQRGRDLMIVLDVSRSMLATDVHPSRLGRAKVDLLDLIKQLRGDRVGLLAFRGKSLLLCPLTTDYGFLSQSLEGAAVDSAPAGETDIGTALLGAMQTLEGDEGSHKAIVLVSDGDDLAGKVNDAIAQAKKLGVAVFTVGFGSTQGAAVPSSENKREAMTFQGEKVVSKLNHGVLRDLAEKTGGAYVPVGLANVKLGDLYRDHLSRITARDLEESTRRSAIERYQLFLFPALLCFLGIAFFSRGQLSMGNPRERDHRPQTLDLRPQTLDLRPHASGNGAKLLAVALVYGLGSMVYSPESVVYGQAATNAAAIPPGREGARLAQKLSLQGKHAEAAEAYQAAAQTAARTTQADYLFNAGCAYLKAGKPVDAADIFRGLTGEEGDRAADAAYNLGCALFKTGSEPLIENAVTPPGPGSPAAGQGAGGPDPDNASRRVEALKQAGTAFQKALRQKPDDTDSRRNLAVTAALTGPTEEQARIIRLMAEHGQSPPGALADMMLLQERTLIHDIPSAFTNTTPALIGSLEALAETQARTADLMIPLKGKLLEALNQAQSSGAISNAQQQAAQVNGFAETIRDQLDATASALRDLNRAATPAATKAEASLYTLWKLVADYSQLLREDILRQTNAISLTVPSLINPTESTRKAVQAEQTEALELTGRFSERFEKSVPPEGITRPVEQASTNEPPAGTNAMEVVLSKEDRQKIVTLAKQAVTVQTEALGKIDTDLTGSLAHQRKAYSILKEIESLLPKDKQKQQQQDQKQNQEQQDKQQQPKEQPKEEPKEQPKEQKKQEPKKGQMSEEELKRLLDKAKQREKEHEQEQRERNAAIPMSPTERDW